MLRLNSSSLDSVQQQEFSPPQLSPIGAENRSTSSIISPICKPRRRDYEPNAFKETEQITEIYKAHLGEIENIPHRIESYESGLRQRSEGQLIAEESIIEEKVNSQNLEIRSVHEKRENENIQKSDNQSKTVTRKIKKSHKKGGVPVHISKEIKHYFDTSADTGAFH